MIIITISINGNTTFRTNYNSPQDPLRVSQPGQAVKGTDRETDVLRQPSKFNDYKVRETHILYQQQRWGISQGYKNDIS